MRAGITGAFEVPGENDNTRRVVEFSSERGLRIIHTLSTGVYINTQWWQGSRLSGDKDHD